MIRSFFEKSYSWSKISAKFQIWRYQDDFLSIRSDTVKVKKIVREYNWESRGDPNGSQDKEDAARSRNGCGANDWSGFFTGSGQAAISGFDDEFFNRCALRASACAVFLALAWTKLKLRRRNSITISVEIPVRFQACLTSESLHGSHSFSFFLFPLLHPFFLFFFPFFFIYNT